MKVCPNCQSRFDQGEAFCPDDGTDLVEAEGLSFGRLTNQTLGETVELGGLVERDAVGARYRGLLLDAEASVAVTVFTQRANPDAARLDELTPMLGTLAGPLPRGVLAAHSLDLEADEPYLVEQAPEGRSLRTILDEEGPLEWQRAVKLTARLARTLDWMAERGHVHRGLHPGAVYITEDDDPTVQIGDWLQLELSYTNEPLEAAERDDGFVGFPAYLAPEAIEADTDFDERSLVYALGMLVYEMILGHPPFDAEKASEVLNSQLDDTPLQLGVASDVGELHPELDNILGMMWDKDPESRFQTPGAIIAALSSLVDESARELGPEPEVADEPIFDVASEDQASSANSGEAKRTLIGMSANDVQKATSDDSAAWDALSKEIDSEASDCSGEAEVDSDSPKADEPATEDSPEQTPEMTAFSPDGDPGVDVTDEWFEVDEKEAWMAADVREERDRSEIIRKYATWTALTFVVLTALGFFLFAQFSG